MLSFSTSIGSYIRDSERSRGLAAGRMVLSAVPIMLASDCVEITVSREANGAALRLKGRMAKVRALVVPVKLTMIRVRPAARVRIRLNEVSSLLVSDWKVPTCMTSFISVSSRY